MSETLTRAEVVTALVERVGLTREDAARVLATMIDAIGEALEQGETVKLVRFGNFKVREKKARIGRNPKTKVEATISPRRVVSFSASTMLKDAVYAENGRAKD